MCFDYKRPYIAFHTLPPQTTCLRAFVWPIHNALASLLLPPCQLVVPLMGPRTPGYLHIVCLDQLESAKLRRSPPQLPGKGGTPCDRRRPFCSQCLDSARNCAGYKTALTWGVGVASRGKLRGLSLPVTGAQPAVAPPKLPRATGPRAVSKSQPALDTAAEKRRLHDKQRSSAAGLTEHGSVSIPPTSQRRLCSPEYYTVDSHVKPNHHNPYSSRATKTDSLKQYHAPLVANPDSSRAWMGLEQTPVPIQCPWPALTPEQKDNASDEQHEETSYNEVSPRMSACQPPSLSQQLLARSVGRTPRLRYLISYYAEVIAPMIVAFDSPTNPFRTYILRLAQESTSLQEAIATLASCNLRQRRERGTRSTERTLPGRLSSMAHQALTDGALQDRTGIFMPEDYAQEEQYHRGMAVSALNRELADSHQRLSDSVLATLLILCLFHGCDTGVAQFKTQFAGVTKLLAIRLCNSPCMSDELKWFVRMFTWIDTMTATTNDREVQLRGACLDITAASDGEWGLENLAGCDAGLFRIVAQLGRLNLLSQNQEVRTSTPPDIHMPSTTLPPSMAFFPSNIPATSSGPFAFTLPPLPPPGDRDRGQLPPAFWAEWYSLRQKLESWRFVPHQSQSQSPLFTSSHAYISPPSSPTDQPVVAAHNLKDVIHISESFRHAAILYSERLAYPDLPSDHPRIQNIVQHIMSHIMTVQSDAYLLWPLFITGSECVRADHRAIIRQRCKDLSRDSGFFNNLSCLQLLEKIWAENPAVDVIPVVSSLDFGLQAAASGCVSEVTFLPPGSWASSQHEAFMSPTLPSVSRKQGFRWHEAMQTKRAEDEYMTV
ncbi:transcriptional regulator family: Fungal Specific TF [Aspergillus niger]|nr:transcriptional regulator family: Fungal Specific TF [Aspergillus niger]